jgi:hypothetical protein
MRWGERNFCLWTVFYWEMASWSGAFALETE